MAIAQTHLRSISLPSRLDQVNSRSFESEFEKLKSGSASSESIQSGLVALAELYNSVEEFSQKSAAHHQQDAKSMEESLSQSVDLLDACSAIREALQMMRENVHALQSAMRRKGTDAAAQGDVAAYFSFRKRMQKSVAKTLRNLKKSESGIVKSESDRKSVNAEGDLGFVLRQLAGITIANFRSVLVFLSYAAAPGGWSLVSKLVAAKSGKEGVNEVENLDLALQGKMRSGVQTKLQTVDEIIEEFEGGFERLFRQLVQTRVTLLNILTDQ